jgi:hypothetical protein
MQLYEADFNCYNQFIFGKQAIQTLTESRYIPEELFSQKRSTAKECKVRQNSDGGFLKASKTPHDNNFSRCLILLR